MCLKLIQYGMPSFPSLVLVAFMGQRMDPSELAHVAANKSFRNEIMLLIMSNPWGFFMQSVKQCYDTKQTRFTHLMALSLKHLIDMLEE